MIIYLVFCCFSAMLGCSYSRLKDSLTDVIFGHFPPEKVGFSNLPEKFWKWLETYKPQHGSLGDHETDHLPHFAEFVSLKLVCTLQFVSLFL